MLYFFHAFPQSGEARKTIKDNESMDEKVDRRQDLMKRYAVLGNFSSSVAGSVFPRNETTKNGKTKQRGSKA